MSKFFFDIAQRLIEYARDGEKEPRQSISDLVLGTVNEDGGRADFRSFRNSEKERDIVRRVGDLILQRIGGKLPAHESLEAIYETVAMEIDVEPEHVKRLFRLYEKDAGSFGFRELRKAATRPPQEFTSGLDTTPASPDDNVHSEEPSD